MWGFGFRVEGLGVVLAFLDIGYVRLTWGGMHM